MFKYEHELEFGVISDLIDVLEGNEEFDYIFITKTTEITPCEYMTINIYSIYHTPCDMISDSYRVVFTSNLKDVEKSFEQFKTQIVNKIKQHLEEVSEFYNGEYLDILDYEED